MSVAIEPPRILPPHYFVISLIAMVGLGLVDESRLLPGHWNLLGSVAAVAGLVFAIQGSRLFAGAGTNIIPFSKSTALVTGGVFSRSRNPMYLGMFLFLAGTALLTNGWLAWLVLFPFIALIRIYFVKHEEELMEATFGEEYLAYKEKVRRWL